MFVMPGAAACSSVSQAGADPKTGHQTVSITGSGNPVTRDVAVADFSEIDAGSALKIDVTQGEVYAVAVTADDNVLDYVEVTKSGPTLRLSMKSGSYANTSVRVAVTMPDITAVRFAGAAKATMVGFKPRNLEVRLSGASQLTGRVDGGQLDVIVADASNLTLGGAADSLKVSASGASQVSLGDLSVNTAVVGLKEASNGTLNVKDRLDADLRSASNLYYVGNPSLGSITSVEASSLRRR